MIQIYNTLSRKIEDFNPLEASQVKMYSCGPTVYDYAHIGNFRTYTTSDLFVRTLRLNGYSVKWVMNITDVGHLVSDGDTGEDKMEKGSRKTGRSAWEIAEFYTQSFLKDWKLLNLSEPDYRPRPTQHIPEQIELVQILLDKGFAYRIDDGIYFDTSKYKDYGKLAHLDLKHLQEGARVEINPQKKNPTDFALWKFSPKNEKRQMEWESPWGIGFPGWHIECSAMSMKYLGEQFDIHTGGTDILPVHHVNEVAQSEAATGKKPWVAYWIHGAMIFVNGQKMSKSLENIYRLDNIIERGFDPLALRYLYLQTHYRQEMNFTWESLKAAEHALNRLRRDVPQGEAESIGCEEFDSEFLDAVNSDLNTSKGLSILWKLIRSDCSNNAKIASIKKIDKVLGLDLLNTERNKKPFKSIAISNLDTNIQKLIQEREEARKKKDYVKSDLLRKKVDDLGYEIRDTEKGIEIIVK